MAGAWGGVRLDRPLTRSDPMKRNATVIFQNALQMIMNERWRRRCLWFHYFLYLVLEFQSVLSVSQDDPNLVIIYTDEQNFRTLGCYRDLLKETKQDEIWGRGVTVATPNINALARKGALFTKFYAASPVCTPARASFLTGLYPHTLDMMDNGSFLDTNIRTFANVLQERNYYTGYVGKWHLSGKQTPGIDIPPMQKAGFNDTRFAFNRGHWQYFDDRKGGKMSAYSSKVSAKHVNKNYSTDFIVDKGIEFLKERKNKKNPFALARFG